MSSNKVMRKLALVLLMSAATQVVAAPVSAANLRGVSFDEAEAMDSHACPAECRAHFRKDGRNHNGLKISERQST